MKSFDNPRVFRMPFSSIYPLYIQKVTVKNRTQEELDQVLSWLTGYSKKQLIEQIENGNSLQAFFDEAPNFTDKAHLITGVICGVRLEEIDHPLMKKVRYMDKVVDELAKGKSLEKIFRN
ncbi:DUF2200 domain-containing protein [Acholeplasma equirhinis]|uniref:DUF2200 domain-containing protein n=1 Tax=Acholeplasma equirhinis TaxID=555393 RepID=UPI00197ACA01|nr:DUF2200 domain-containing protein [Acholeplasma equirhinis]MBN3490154.1 DUF2200 domain-containing protein [Acholeplasma equirhinis]